VSLCGFLQPPSVIINAICSVAIDFDRSFSWYLFFLSDIYIAGEVLHYQGGSPVLFEHLFWFLGHPVYIVLLPALGIASEVIATNARANLWLQSDDYVHYFFSTIVGHTCVCFWYESILGSVFTLQHY
jgi:cytochrome c oxidase subunit 1